MAFCIVCNCGKEIRSETKGGFPNNCPVCKRYLFNFEMFDENDPRLEERLNSLSAAEEKPRTSANDQKRKYVLKLVNSGKEIDIPDEGCVIGRTEIGAEELAEFSSVSRRHLEIFVGKNTVYIEDISQYGTKVNGASMEKNIPIEVTGGEKITLCNVDAEFVIKGEDR